MNATPMPPAPAPREGAHAPCVQVLVLNFCSGSDTLACVEAIRQLDYPNYRLLVTDNASPDGSGAELQAAIPAHEFLQTGRNLGYAGGNNLGIRRALEEGAEYVFIVNPDVRLPPSCLADYVALMESDPTIGALNAVQLQQDGAEIDQSFRRGVLMPAGRDQARFDPASLPETFETPVVYGAALLLSRRALERVGGFDPLYFAYFEEIDLCRRLRRHGFRLVVTTRSPVLHIRTQYQKPLSRRVRFLRLKGYYLSRLKNADNALASTARAILREIRTALFGDPSRLYPFDTYPLDRVIVIRTLAWLVWHLPAVMRHRQREILPGMHYLPRAVEGITP
ncbi:MAG: glycosyltransferase family 2 protein [Acetobacteraceae bacterium]